jgi:hypothetical protein
MRHVHTLPAQSAATRPRPEVALLLCCARTCLDTATAERLSVLLQHDLDWSYVISVALQHGVMPLLYQHLHTLGPDALPPAALMQMREHFYANVGSTLFLSGELLRILQMLATHGIPALPFKGPTLAAAVYGNLALRQFSDLDILVHKQDLPRIKVLLTTHGYQLPLTRAKEEAVWKHHYHYAFVREDGRVLVEMHWAFTRRYWPVPLDPAYLWARPALVSLAGTPVSTFPPEVLLLILCVHGSKERWTLLKWVCDVAELLRRHQALDWERVLARARSSGGVRMLLLGLSVAHHLLGAALPQEVMRRIQANPVVHVLAVQVCAQLCARLNGVPWAVDRHTFYLRTRERVQDRMRYFLFGYLREGGPQLLTPNAHDQALLPLPPQCAFFYYLLRPLRLAVVHGRHLVTALLKHLPGW